MNRQAWVTRRHDRGMAEGQSAASVAAIEFRQPEPAAAEA
jgi:hypothetical protein